MHPIDRVDEAIRRLREDLGDTDPTVSAAALSDAALVRGLTDIADARKAFALLEAAYAAEIDRRSDRALGYAGLAQRAGHRNATALIQQVTGQTRSDVQRATSAGRDLAARHPSPPSPGAADDAAREEPWFSPLADALGSGELSREQYDAIRRGLGEPPEAGDALVGAEALVLAWREAALLLIEEASNRPVEDLRAAARLARDTLDPIGTQRRFDERFANRSFVMWVDESGQHHARLRLDDDTAAWVRTMLSAALRPRRGPRFVDSGSGTANDDAAAAAGEDDDARTNEQLQYDTLVAILRTGAHADPAQAFGDRQPGIRIVVTQRELERRDEHGSITGVGCSEETGQALPGGVLETYLCNAGTKIVTVDGRGNPLDVGRERRLFTKRQRDAMAVRDGGCRWCGAEPSRCEAHHIDHWWEHRGRTDIADGVLLCRNCHMRVHNQRLRITRAGDEYRLTWPPGTARAPRLLPARSLLRFAGLADGAARRGPG